MPLFTDSSLNKLEIEYRMSLLVVADSPPLNTFASDLLLRLV